MYQINIRPYIYNNNKAERVFIMRSFCISNILNNSFYDVVISLLRKRKVFQPALCFPFHTNHSETYQQKNYR